jgi:hypothetical protein
VVGAELDLIAILGGALRCGHDRGIVEEDVKLLRLAVEIPGRLLNALK